MWHAKADEIEAKQYMVLQESQMPDLPGSEGSVPACLQLSICLDRFPADAQRSRLQMRTDIPLMDTHAQQG